jgi:hypothetical protein
MLQVGVHEHDSVSSRSVHSGGEGNLVTEVSREGCHTHAWIGGHEAVQLRERVVSASVINEEDFVIDPVQGAENRLQSAEKGAYDFGLVEAGNNDGQQLSPAPVHFVHPPRNWSCHIM